MNAVVAEISSAKLVSLKTDYGTLVGEWNGELPKLPAVVHVELEFEADRKIAAADEKKFLATSPSPKRITLSGIVEFWSENLLNLRVGASVIQIEASGIFPAGSWVIVEGKALRFFDLNL